MPEPRLVLIMKSPSLVSQDDALKTLVERPRVSG